MPIIYVRATEILERYIQHSNKEEQTNVIRISLHSI